MIYCKLLKLQANVEELNQSQCMGTSILIGLVILLLPGTLTIQFLLDHKRQIKGNCDTIVSGIGEDILLISVTNNVRKLGERIVQSKL